ncbi:hypothetical protein Acsp03_31990 [Actinomadura sp. NBRC 104412]|uniref:hypothetical protein n=1 Tax=Actinomadura sp. NBRC 104412 TaxID=3032203 RepID=UPI0024A42809|nr:hypothetical protein [Actinomadura sp. NBRC 104412]GLZ05733.1 hypothetical protein Acsp03_31990 [Actinomadura sp. NBRC 104412]
MKCSSHAVKWAVAAVAAWLVLVSCGGSSGEDGAGAAPPTASGTPNAAVSSPSASPSAQPTPGTPAPRNGRPSGQSSRPAARTTIKKVLSDCMREHGVVLPTDGSVWSPSPGADTAKAQAALKECLKSLAPMSRAQPGN